MVDDVTLDLAVSAILFSLTILLFTLFRIARMLRYIRSERLTVEQSLGYIEQRLERIQTRVTDLMVRVDLLSTGLPARYERTSEKMEVSSQALPTKILDSTEKQILSALSSGPKTVTELRNIVARTREHTARLMKGLFDKGLVTRDSSKKPYVYFITEEGKRKLSGT